jgi:hypothetical protein
MKSKGEVESLKRRLANAEGNLRLVRERKSEYVQQADVPLQLIKDERWWEQEIKALRAQLEEDVADHRHGTYEPFLIETPNRGTWLIQNGQRRRLQDDGPTHRALERFHVYSGPDEELDKYQKGKEVPARPPQVVQDKEGRIYLIRDELIINGIVIVEGTKVEIDGQIADYLTDSYLPLSISTEKLSHLRSLSPLPPDTAERMCNSPFCLIKGEEGEEKYLLKDPFIRWIRRTDVKNKLIEYLELSPIQSIELASYTRGPPILRLTEQVIQNLQKWKRSSGYASSRSLHGESASVFYALLVGVGGYSHPHFASLPATVRDAQAIAAILTDPARCGYPSTNVEIITGSDATVANIRAALKILAESTNSESTALVYFSGHGGRALENSVWRAYLCPREADPDDLAHTAISGDDFGTLLAAIPARKLLVVLDACHAGGSAELKVADGTFLWKVGLPDDYYEALSQGSGRVVIASSKENEFSFVHPQGDLSLFTYHLRDALGGRAAIRSDGLIHVLDVFHYVNEAVHADEPKQTPILKAKDLDLNFPIALALGGKAAGLAVSVTPVADIREQIIRAPIAGAKALSEYLATHPEWAAKRDEVDLKRAELERIQHDLDLFGPNPSDKAAKNRAVYFLLRACLELEQSERAAF